MPPSRIPAAVGIDFVSWTRIKSLLEHHAPASWDRVLTPLESEKLRQAPDPVRFFARCFTAKEAYLKARGDASVGPESFSEIEISFQDEDRFRAHSTGNENGENREGEFFETPDGIGARLIFWEER